MWSAIATGIGSVVSALFGFKKSQADSVAKALEVIGDANASNAQREQAIATIIAAEAGSGYWLAAVWRPLLMVFFAFLLGMYWFGYTPPNMDQAMSPMMEEIFSILKIGIGGYIPARTVEKIVQQINVGAILKKFIEKKVL